jgi:hypothetical protein
MRSNAKSRSGGTKLFVLVVVTVVISALAYLSFATFGKHDGGGVVTGVSRGVESSPTIDALRQEQSNTQTFADQVISWKRPEKTVLGTSTGQVRSRQQEGKSSIDLHDQKATKSSLQKVNTAVASKVSWTKFANAPITERGIERNHKQKARPLNPDFKPVLCSDEVVSQLAAPQLSKEDFEWCRSAISPTGGNVVVGKSWGRLTTKQDQHRFDTLNCNAVQSGKNPSCDDSWGDRHIQQWRSNVMPQYNCEAGRKSKVTCHANDNKDKFCTIENAQINFARMKKMERGGGQTPSKQWGKDFLSADCGKSVAEGFPFSHLYSPTVSTKQCDYVHNGTLLLFSHDDIRNLGHTLNDIFNVWMSMWLDGVARDSHALNMLNVDSFKLGHNFNDEPNAFFLPYTKNLHSILKGRDFGAATLCVQKLLIQPVPPRFFIWESWFTDMPCSFIGPSSLYQRWNLHVRHSYGLLRSDPEAPLNQRLQVLLVIRNEKSNLWGSSRTSRNYVNTDEITASLNATLRVLSKKVPTTLVAIDLSTLVLEEQLRLIADSSIMIGMHGAGMASAMHMSVGTKYCCGMIEVSAAVPAVVVCLLRSTISSTSVPFLLRPCVSASFQKCLS